MPRPARSQGRPNTRVIPNDWSASHAPVAENTMADGHGTLTRGGSAAPSFRPDLGHSATPDPVPYWDGPARVQVSNAQEAQQRTGDQTVLTLTYLVAVPRAVEATEGDVFRLDRADDPSLVGVPLVVRAVSKGTHRFERDLHCVEDTTAPRPVTP